MSKKSLYIFFCTIVGIIASYYIAILLHEYGHATTAWLFNLKSSPFDIIYGNWYLIPVSENVDYSNLYATNRGMEAGLIGISGITVSIILFFICVFFLKQQRIKNSILLLSLFFWLADMNLMEIFSYIPNRSFIMGDILEFALGFNIHPAWIALPGVIVVFAALYWFYRYQVPQLYTLLPIKTQNMRRIFLLLTFWPLIFSIIYWEPPIEYKVLSYSANILSVFIILFLVKVSNQAGKQIK